MSESVPTTRFPRRPYTVTYRSIHDGEIHKIRRVPPPKLHQALPTDVVTLTRKKNDRFDEGDEFEVKHIAKRHPNVLQLVNDDGETTFVDYYDVDIEERVAMRGGVDPRDDEENNRYLLWP